MCLVEGEAPTPAGGGRCYVSRAAEAGTHTRGLATGGEDGSDSGIVFKSPFGVFCYNPMAGNLQKGRSFVCHLS